MEVRYERLEKAFEQSSNEVKSLKKKLKEAQNSINESDSNVEISEEEEFLIKNKSKGFRKTSPQCEPEAKFKCTVCKDTFNKERVFNKHMEMHDKDGDWTCGDLECSFQTISKEKLMNHKHIAHPRAISEGEGGRSVTRNKEASEITCYSCNKQFVYKIDLVKHVQETHRAFKPCRNRNNCSYGGKETGGRCHFSHRKYPEDHHVCYECGDYFRTVHDLMMHRKTSHMVPTCKEFLKNKCDRSNNDCYYSHQKKAHSITQNIEQPSYQGQGFWEPPSNLAPPSQELISPKGPSQSEWIQMKTMLMELNKMVAKLQ